MYMKSDNRTRYTVGVHENGYAFKPMFSGLKVEVFDAARLLVRNGWPKAKIAFVRDWDSSYMAFTDAEVYETEKV